jgi:hypothetical protein
MRAWRLGARALGVVVLGGVVAGCGGTPEPSPTPEPPVSPAPTLVPTVPPTTAAAPSPVPATSPATSPAAPLASPVTKTPATVAAAPIERPSTAPPTAAPPTLPTPPPIDHARVARLVQEGETASAQGQLADAERLFGEALALDAGSAPARKGKARAVTTRLGLTRTLVPDIASSEGAEGRVKEMEGFDEVEDMNVRRAVRIPGRTELDTAKKNLKPGDPYTVTIYLRNQSKKKRVIQVANVNVRRFVNDKESVVTIPWNKVAVPNKQRLLVGTFSGTWDDDVTSFILDVRLLSEGGDIYQNRLVWK